MNNSFTPAPAALWLTPVHHSWIQHGISNVVHPQQPRHKPLHPKTIPSMRTGPILTLTGRRHTGGCNVRWNLHLHLHSPWRGGRWVTTSTSTHHGGGEVGNNLHLHLHSPWRGGEVGNNLHLHLHSPWRGGEGRWVTTSTSTYYIDK